MLAKLFGSSVLIQTFAVIVLKLNWNGTTKKQMQTALG